MTYQNAKDLLYTPGGVTQLLRLLVLALELEADLGCFAFTRVARASRLESYFVLAALDCLVENGLLVQTNNPPSFLDRCYEFKKGRG